MEKEYIGNNVKETNSLDYSKGEQLIEKKMVENTPFTVMYTKEEGWAFGIAQYRLSEWKKTEAEVMKEIKGGLKDWSLITRVIGIMIEISNAINK